MKGKGILLKTVQSQVCFYVGQPGEIDESHMGWIRGVPALLRHDQHHATRRPEVREVLREQRMSVFGNEVLEDVRAED